MLKVLRSADLQREEIPIEYGLKAQGLSTLARFLHDERFRAKVPDIFAVPTSVDLESTEVKEAYCQLASGFEMQGVILARSSDPEESPGKFESHTSIVFPDSVEEGYENWVKAAHRVKESGARAVIGQVLAAGLDDLVVRSEDSPNRELVSIRCFGAKTSSFFGDSRGLISGRDPEIRICYGLGDKLARRDEDITFLYMVGRYMYGVSLMHAYDSHAGGIGLAEQRSIDVIIPEEGSIRNLPYLRVNDNGTFINERTGRVPIDGEFLGCNPNHKLRSLFRLLGYLREYAGSEVEIEANIDNGELNIFQLTPYQLPRRSFRCLSGQPDDRMILKEDHSYGFQRMEGDLIISHRMVECGKQDIFLYTGNIESAGQFRGYNNVLFLLQRPHPVMQAAQMIVKLDNMGIRSACLSDEFNRLSTLAQDMRPDQCESHGDYKVVKGVRVECASPKAQIYFKS